MRRVNILALKSFILVLAILIANQSHANICADLAAHTCAKGERHDGTGSTKPDDVMSFVESEIKNIRPRLKSDFANLIDGEQGSQLRALAIKGYGVEDERVCAPSNDNPKCISLLTDFMIESYKLREFGNKIQSTVPLATDALALATLFNSESYQRAARQISQEQKAAVPKELLEKVDKEIFPKVKILLEKHIKSLAINEDQKAAMLSKIATATYAGAECMEENASLSGIAAAFVPNAFYNSGTNSFRFCYGYFRASNSEFNIVHTIAHELSHAISPCFISEDSVIAPYSQKISNAAVDNLYLRKNFLRCLRSPNSVRAKLFTEDDPGQGEVYNDTQRLCARDETSEAVPDWFAAEVLGQYAETHLAHLPTEQKQIGFANVLRATCRETRDSNSRHPNATNRINGLLLVQPKIREQMQCKGDVPNRRYCDLNNPDSLIGKPLKSGAVGDEPLKRGSEKTKQAVK